LIQLQEVLKHKDLLLFEIPLCLPIEDHVFLKVVNEASVHWLLLKVEDLHGVEGLPHETLAEPINLVPVAIFEDKLHDVTILQFLKLEFDIPDLLLVELCHLPQLLEGEDVSDDCCTLQQDDRAKGRLTWHFMQEKVPHQGLLQDRRVLLLQESREGDVIEAICLHPILQPLVAQKCLLLDLDEVVL